MQFRTYIGLITNPHTTHNKTKGRPISEQGEEGTGDAEQEISDDEADAMPVDDAHAPLPESKIEEVDPNSPIDTFSRIEFDSEDLKQQRIDSFLLDPELSIKVFFTSYFRDRGLFWSDFNLRTGPVIVSYFLGFIIRHRAFPEFERGFKHAQEVAERAKKELPQTKLVALAIPEGWGKACRALWDSMVPQKWGAGVSDSFMESIAALQTEGNATPQPIPVPTTLEMIDEAIEVDLNDPTQNGTAAAGEWDAIPPSDDQWGADEGENGWNADEFYSKTQAAQTWDTIPIPTACAFMSIIGPSTMPLTHAPARAEMSTRVVLSFAPPSTSHLHANLATIVLGPCADRLKSPSLTPAITPPDMLLDKATEFNFNVVGGESHDPLTSCITVFVEPTAIDNLAAGLLLGGVWVQVAPIPGVEAVAEQSSKKKGKSGKSQGAAADGKIWWYAENVDQVLPSFWTEVAPDH